jgi:hypothetical protein
LAGKLVRKRPVEVPVAVERAIDYRINLGEMVWTGFSWGHVGISGGYELSASTKQGIY